MSRLRPKVVLWWGIGLIVVNLVLSYAVPGIAFAANGNAGDGSSTLDQGMLNALFTLLSTVNSVAPFLGVTLIGASTVMFYIAKNLIPATQQPDAVEASGKRAASGD